MKIELIDTYGVASYSPNPSKNYFITIKEDNTTLHVAATCRVEFELYMKEMKYHKRIAFKKSSLNMDVFNDFWKQIFKKLGTKSKFIAHDTNLPDVFVIDLPDFWLKTETNRSLFSLLLRGSLCYHKAGDDIIATMKRYSLANIVILAIEWFLKGNIIPTYDKLTKKCTVDGYPGFVGEFEKLTQEEIEAKLVKPTRRLTTKK